MVHGSKNGGKSRVYMLKPRSWVCTVQKAKFEPIAPANFEAAVARMNIYDRILPLDHDQEEGRKQMIKGAWVNMEDWRLLLKEEEEGRGGFWLVRFDGRLPGCKSQPVERGQSLESA